MNYTVEALQDGLAVLRVVAHHPGLGVSEIGRRTGFTKARTFRFLATFEAAGVVQRAADGVSYNLGPAALVIGLAAQEQVSLVKLAEKYLNMLVAKYNETATVLVRDGLESVSIAQKNSTHEMRVQATVGRRRPLHAGASGKVLLAFGPESIENLILEGELPKLAPQTITSKTRLKKELQRTRELGYATSLSEGAVDVVAVAAPVYGSAGFLVGSIGLSMPQSRAPDDLSGIARVVGDVARQLSVDLGWDQTPVGRR